MPCFDSVSTLLVEDDSRSGSYCALQFAGYMGETCQMDAVTRAYYRAIKGFGDSRR